MDNADTHSVENDIVNGSLKLKTSYDNSYDKITNNQRSVAAMVTLE